MVRMSQGKRGVIPDGNVRQIGMVPNRQPVRESGVIPDRSPGMGEIGVTAMAMSGRPARLAQ
jgi:hypothetical protein